MVVAETRVQEMDHSHNYWAMPRHILSSNDMYLRVERYCSPSYDSSNKTVDNLRVCHDDLAAS